MFEKNSHCSYCGTAFLPDSKWPRTCARCGNMSFLNPLPVAVVLVPVEGGLVTIRRGVEPQRGKLALPGGFINLGESWQAAGARELFEEAGITVHPSDIREFGVENGTDGVIVIFGLAPPVSASAISPFKANEEATERVVITEAIDLAFPLHTEIVRVFFHSGRSPRGN